MDPKSSLTTYILQMEDPLYLLLFMIPGTMLKVKWHFLINVLVLISCFIFNFSELGFCSATFSSNAYVRFVSDNCIGSF